jgi:site-specific DNA recombinase
VTSLRCEITKLEHRLSKIYEDKIDGLISMDQWQGLHDKYSNEIEELNHQISRHTDANIDYYEEGVKILELAEDAYSQYVSQNNYEKRKLLDFVVSKFIVRGDEYTPIYRQPFDMLALYKAETDKKNRQSDSKLPIHQLWRPQGDSNPCCRRERAVS